MTKLLDWWSTVFPQGFIVTVFVPAFLVAVALAPLRFEGRACLLIATIPAALAGGWVWADFMAHQKRRR